MTSNDHNKLLAIWLLEVVALFTLILVMTSCYGPKKAAQQANKALIKHPDVIAKIARDAFPCQKVLADSSGYFDALDEVGRITHVADSLGSIINHLQQFVQGLKADSIAARNCGELLQQVENYTKEVEAKNSQLNSQVKNMKPVSIPMWYEDSAKIHLANKLAWQQMDTANKYKALHTAEVDRRKEAEAKLQAELDKGKGKITVRIPIWVVIVSFLLGAGGVTAKIKKTLNPLKWFG